jgi:lipopolysaccharide/colanic/teichoic acid biosynthesis glycosyltransferase
MISFLAILILSPILLVLSFIVFFKLGQPVLFCQKRPGKDDKIFTLYKFRTMTADRNSSGELLPDIGRITRFGSFLRKTSLDELPQVFNVFKGDLSFIGPRPLLIEYLSLYDSEQRKRHNVKPGITGWAQVNGRNSLTWNEKFDLDIFYVNNVSFLFDLKILLKSFSKVFKGSDINSSDGNTMPKFTGSN